VSRAAGRWGIRAVLAGGLLLAATACTGGDRRPRELRMATESFTIRVTSDPSPPRALESVTWTIVVTDRATGRPIDQGEGRIFASSRDGKNIANGFAPTEQIGTYRTTLQYITAGTWAMGIQFRIDSTRVLERTEDWTQDVRTGSEPWEMALPSSRIPETPATPVRSDTTDAEGAVPPR
jgi:hypothetical protein